MDSPRTRSERRAIRSYGIKEESKKTLPGFRVNRNPGRGGRGRGGERWEEEAEGRRARAREAERKRVERERRLRPEVRKTDAANAAWSLVLAALERSLKPITFALWVEPLRILGEVNNALWVEGSDGVAGWAERRYASLIGETIRELTDYRGFFLGRVSEERDSGDGVL